MTAESKSNLLELDLPGLERFVASLGQPAYRGRQLHQWMYAHRVTDFAGMNNIARTFRDVLAEHSEIRLPQEAGRATATDGTVRYLWSLPDGCRTESVYIPGNERNTVCLSTQVGCALKCVFCATGRLGFTRNLTRGEIVGQLLAVLAEGKQVTNLVVMGQGEPLLNLENLLSALASINHELGPAIAARHVTISTAGIPEGIRALADSGRKYKLALSLGSPDPAVRTRLMPIEQRYPLKTLLPAMEYYYSKVGEWLTWEYILVAGVNDRAADRNGLIALCKRIPSKINLLSYHPVAGCDLTAPTREAMLRFQESLIAENVTVLIRESRGREIAAACGMLASQGSGLDATVDAEC